MPVHKSTLALLRVALLLILLVGMVGTGAELLLLEHTEGFWQWSPVALLGLGIAVSVWTAVRPGRLSLRTLQVLMVGFVASGLLGLVLHYDGNVQFELELHASARGWELFREALGGATPTLAPGTMIQLGLVGLVYTYRHPALGGTGSTLLE